MRPTEQPPFDYLNGVLNPRMSAVVQIGHMYVGEIEFTEQKCQLKQR